MPARRRVTVDVLGVAVAEKGDELGRLEVVHLAHPLAHANEDQIEHPGSDA
jgi:hypothetical protein